MSRNALHSARKAEAVNIGAGDHTVTMTFPTGLYVGGAGNVVCRFDGDSNDTTLTGLVAGVVYPFQIRVVRQTSTTATNLVILSG